MKQVFKTLDTTQTSIMIFEKWETNTDSLSIALVYLFNSFQALHRKRDLRQSPESHCGNRWESGGTKARERCQENSRQMKWRHLTPVPSNTLGISWVTAVSPAMRWHWCDFAGPQGSFRWGIVIRKTRHVIRVLEVSGNFQLSNLKGRKEKRLLSSIMQPLI